VSPTVKPARQRLDQLLVDRGLADSRSRAQALVLAGKVGVGEGDGARRDRKPGDLLPADTPIAIADPEPYVSRGGHKLAAAIDAFAIEPAGLVCLDVGASTGGFTDVLLQRGASRVYAVDVGRGQLAESLRNDPRVVSMERTNARELTAASLPEPVALATIDVSFISLALVLGPVGTFTTGA
jgi:23S rRNA (cytidine1920-2'-O)/16S rRNA (cytidine1409-2'-O)-methyltransferase